MGSVRRTLANLGLAAASAALGLGSIEALARLLYDPHPQPEAKTERSRYIRHDPWLGWRLRPGAEVTYRRAEYVVEVRINSQGLRDVERQYASPPGGFRILALGDSFVEAYSVPLEDSVTQVLERSISGTGCRVEVLNGGVGGYSTDQEYLFYELEGRRYAPRVVVVFFYYNDVMPNALDRYWREAKPRLAERDGRLEVANYPVPAPPKPRRRPGPKRRPLLHGSAALDWAAHRLARGAPEAFDALAGLGLWPRLEPEAPDPELRVYKRRRIEEVELGWSSTDRIVKAFSELAAAEGSELLIAYVPSAMEVNDRVWEITRRRYGMREPLWDRGLVIERLRQLSDAHGVRVLDLTPALRAADRGLLGSPYYGLDNHWNALGHGAAAEALAGDLSRSGWLPDCPR